MILRRRHTANFTTIGNALFDDERLAADEVGILVYLLSRPHNWEVRRPALMRRWELGPVTMKRIVRNWMRTGWCQAKKVRLKSGRFCILYDIYDEPGKELSDDEIREALSLVSGEASADDSVSEMPDNEANYDPSPPLSPPGVADHLVVDEGWPIRDITNTELPNTDSTQKIERERAREKEKHALNLAEFKRRWPTAASDDQATIDAAWFDLSPQDGDDALAGIVPFLENLKRDRRTHVPAGWKYLRQRRWTLLAPAKTQAPPSGYPRDSVEAKALAVLHDIVGTGDFFRKVHRRSDGTISYPKPVTPQLAALALAGPQPEWTPLTRPQAAAWETLFRETVTVQVRKRLKEGDRAPWPWPPSVDGKIYTTATGPPETLMTEQDLADFK
jgi:hypothetical protein